MKNFHPLSIEKTFRTNIYAKILSWSAFFMKMWQKLANLYFVINNTPGIDKSLALERKIESRKRNFSLDLENLIVPISLSTLDFREWQETILFLLSIFESGKNKFSFHSRFSRVARQISLSTLVFFSIFESSNREFNIIYSRWFKIDQPISVPEVWYYFFTYDLDWRIVTSDLLIYWKLWQISQ